ncbi:glycosyltransferase family 39 protein [Streptomyces sp. NPDC049954]|uniref:glycosyltransferase family 39 protein n=1 Tax=Streptomyces sp. NPDC049954 TaxID=3155779 RepID=UPI00342E00D9
MSGRRARPITDVRARAAPPLERVSPGAPGQVDAGSPARVIVPHARRPHASETGPPAAGPGAAGARPFLPPAVRRTAAVLVPALVAFLLGLYRLDRGDSMWRDESVTYQVAHRSTGQLRDLLGNIDAVHGLYYVLMHEWFALWDGGLTALRLPSVLATALAAAGVAATVLRYAGPRTSLLSGLAYTLVPITQQYAQEGRSYALVSAAVAWCTYFFARAAAGRGGRGAWVAYGLLGLIACWLHEFAFLALLAHGVTLVWGGARRAVRRSWALVAGLVLLGVTPLAVVSLGQSDAQIGWLGRPCPLDWLIFLAVAVLGVLAARTALAAWPVRARLRQGRGQDAGARLVALGLPLLVLPSGLLMVASLAHPWYVDRYCLYTFQGLGLLAGAATVRAYEGLRRRGTALRVLCVTGAAAAACAVLLPWYALSRAPESRKDDVLAVADAVRELSRPGDAVLFMPGRRREWGMSGKGAYAGLRDLALKESPVASRTLQGTELPARTIRERVARAPRVLALRDLPDQPLDTTPTERAKRAALRHGFVACRTIEVTGARVTLFARPGGCG